MKIIQVLEQTGLQVNFDDSATSSRRRLLMKSMLPDSLKFALLSNNTSALEELIGLKKDIICYIASPARESDMPKDDNKPSEDDEPPYEEKGFLKAG